MAKCEERVFDKLRDNCTIQKNKSNSAGNSSDIEIFFRLQDLHRKNSFAEKIT